MKPTTVALLLSLVLLCACHHNSDADRKGTLKAPEPGSFGILAAGVVITVIAMRKRK